MSRGREARLASSAAPQAPLLSAVFGVLVTVMRWLLHVGIDLRSWGKERERLRARLVPEASAHFQAAFP